MLFRLVTRIAQSMLRIRARLFWKQVEKHVASCKHRQCKHYREQGFIPIDQDESMFCRYGNRLWAKHWDMCEQAENIVRL